MPLKQRLLLLLPLLVGSVATAQTERELDVHNHGEAYLDIAIDGGQVAISMASPAANLVGFEHKPESDEQLTQIDNAKKSLEDYSNVFRLSEAAKCEALESDVHWTLDDAREHEEHAEHEEHGETHSEFEAEYLLSCSNMESLKSIEVLLFERFPAIEKIRLQTLFTNSQSADMLTPENSKIEVP